VDLQHLNGSDKRVGRMLVEFDTFGGLSEEIDIGWQGGVFQQKLDFLEVSFRCTS